MALRKVRVMGDDVLRKKCKEVKEVNERTKVLIDDMFDTMYEENGVGLAAPQVGILKRIVVIDIGEGKIELVNPKIVKAEGSQTGQEGCLSVPGVWGEVERPNEVTVEAFDRNGNKFQVSGTELLARAFCHELDHLEGELFLDKATKIEEN